MARLITTATLSTLAISAALALGPTSAQAHASIICGATITTDTKLTNGLLNCPDKGIVIGADDITLDLNRHTIGGDGAPVASCPDGATCDVGIDNSAGHTGVTIKGGQVQGFDVGLLVLGASKDYLQRISSANNSSFGMIIGHSTQSRVDHNSSIGDGVSGIVVFDSNNLRINHNLVKGSHGYAIPVFGSSHNRLEQNLLEGNDHGILLDDSDGNTVRGNRVSHSGGSSIDIGNANANRVSENVLTANGDGVILFQAKGNHVSDNSVTGTGFFGFPDSGGFGIILDGADDNLVLRNTVTGGRGPAILVSSLDSPNTSDRNAIANNVVSSKLDAGLRVSGNANATLLEHNTANGSHDDGIHADAAGTTLTSNTAEDNLDLGIEAVPGVIDGGGNKASGNGNPAECLNVVCK